MIKVLKEIVGAGTFAEVLERIKKGNEDSLNTGSIDRGDLSMLQSANNEERAVIN